MSLVIASGSAWSAPAANGTEAAIPRPDAPRLDGERTVGLETTKLGIGDKINVSIYERRESEEDKWGPAQQRPQHIGYSFMQRPELSGERSVQTDGSISFPFMGRINAAGLSGAQLEAELTSLFEKHFGRKGFVNIVSVEQSPVYIVGPVRNAGAFKHVQGMTVLHLVALAGGTARGGNNDAWSTLESIRETQRANRSVEVLARSIAKSAALRAERDDGTAKPPARLIHLVGEARGQAILGEEISLRALRTNTRKAREASLDAALSSAKAEVEAMEGRIAPLDAEVKLRNDRFEAVNALHKKGFSSNTTLVQVRSELSDAQNRRQDAVAAVAAARRRADQSADELTRHRLEARAELEQEIATVSREIDDNIAAIESSKDSIDAMQSAGAETARSPGAISYEIVRRTTKGVELIPASETSELEPGDLVRMKSASIQVSYTASLSDETVAAAKPARLQK